MSGWMNECPSANALAARNGPTIETDTCWGADNCPKQAAFNQPPCPRRGGLVPFLPPIRCQIWGGQCRLFPFQVKIGCASWDGDPKPTRGACFWAGTPPLPWCQPQMKVTAPGGVRRSACTWFNKSLSFKLLIYNVWKKKHAVFTLLIHQTILTSFTVTQLIYLLI